MLVLLLSDVSLELQGGRQLASRNRKVVRQELEFADVSCARDGSLVCRLNALADELLDLWMCDCFVSRL